MEEKILKALQEKGAMRPGDIAAAAGVEKPEADKAIKNWSKRARSTPRNAALRHSEVAA